jgi:hypothetical protein
MDDQTRSIIRNVKGPGMFLSMDAEELRLGSWRFKLLTGLLLQSAKTTFSASSSPSVKPAVCDKCVFIGGDIGKSKAEQSVEENADFYHNCENGAFYLVASKSCLVAQSSGIRVCQGLVHKITEILDSADASPVQCRSRSRFRCYLRIRSCDGAPNCTLPSQWPAIYAAKYFPFRPNLALSQRSAVNCEGMIMS